MIKGIKLLYPRQSNGVFVDLPIPVIEALHNRGWHFYTFIGETGARLMCSWDTTTEDVDDFVADLTELMSNPKKLASKTKRKKRKNH